MDSIARLLSRLLRLLTIALTLSLGGLPSQVLSAPMVIMEVRGTAFKVGGSVDSAQTITLKEGERLVVIGPDGKTITRRGPFNGPLMDTAAGAPDPKQALSVLIASRDARTSSIGVVRSGAGSVKLPSPWLVDVTRPGQRCLQEGEVPVMWRPESEQALPFVIFAADRSWRADFQWKAGEAQMRMPPLSRFQGMTTMLVNIDQQEHAISFSAIPKAVDNPIVLVAWMLEKGCIPQADAILESMRSAAVANEKSSTQTLKQSLAATFIVVIAALTATLATRHLAFLANLENVAADIRVAAFQPPMPQSKEIAVIAINEDTLSRFAYRSPVDRAFLASLLAQLDAKGAKAIGLDVLLDQPTEPAKDALLAKTIRQLKTPVFVSYTNTPGHVTEDQLDYLNQFVPKELRAAANLATDPFDGSVRWIFPGETGPEVPPSFSRKAVAMMGRPLPPARQPEIAWRVGPDADTPPFPIYPAHAVAALPKAWFEGRLLLIGATLSLTDRHRTPMAILYDDARGMMPGILVQAHSISQLLEGRSAERASGLQVAGFCLLFAAIGVAIGLLKRSIAFNFLMGMIVLTILWLGGVLGYAHGLPLVPLLAPSLALALSLWMMDTFIGKAERKQKEFIQGAFSRYVSPAVVEQLVENPAALSLTGRRQEASFLFTDIAGFTTLAEKLASDQLSDLLNAYLDGACAIIQKHQGTIDKFIGDAIMAVFNAPLPQADHKERAVRCALELDAYAEGFRIAQSAKGISLGVTRIGLHCGIATIGNFGSQSRMDFTALGDTVNTAARTEGVNKYFGTRICCTQEIMQGCPDLAFRLVGEVVLKGKEMPVMLYQPLGGSNGERELLSDYRAAYAELTAGAPRAVHAFERLRAKYPQDPLIDFYWRRTQSGNLSTRIVMDEK